MKSLHCTDHWSLTLGALSGSSLTEVSPERGAFQAQTANDEERVQSDLASGLARAKRKCSVTSQCSQDFVSFAGSLTKEDRNDLEA